MVKGDGDYEGDGRGLRAPRAVTPGSAELRSRTIACGLLTKLQLYLDLHAGGFHLCRVLERLDALRERVHVGDKRLNVDLS